MLDIVLTITWLHIRPKHSGDVCFSDQLCNAIMAFWSPLESVWQRVGYAGNALDAQRRSAVDRIGSLMRDLTADAEQQERQLLDSINKKQVSIENLSKELGLPSSVEVYDSGVVSRQFLDRQLHDTSWTVSS